jgi:ankyrin repeat protein
MNLLTLARDNQWQKIEQLVERGMDVMTANQMGQTALHIASLWGHVETIQALLRLGADASVENVRGSVPLHFAACAKDNALEACKVGEPEQA